MVVIRARLCLTSLIVSSRRHLCTGSTNGRSSGGAIMVPRPTDQDVVVPPRGGQPHTKTLIWLHGLGDSGHGWAAEMPNYVPDNVKIICPTAPVRAVTLNAGARMNAWFDRVDLTPEAPDDEEGIKEAAGWIHDLIAREETDSGILPANILLGGFSQGGALSLYAGLTYKTALAGICALSCWFLLYKKSPYFVQEFARSTPVFQAHGSDDDLVSLKWAEMTKPYLKEMLSEYKFHTYRGLSHTTSRKEMHDVEDFFKYCLTR